MARSIASINSLLVGLKTISSSILVKLNQLGFNTSLTLGEEHEYTVKSLICSIDSLSIQLLTITANRNQFIQRTGYNERKEIESCLSSLLICMQQTQEQLATLSPNHIQCDETQALSYRENGELYSLKLQDAVVYLDLLKPYSRMLEMVTAQERIHALSAILNNLLSRESQQRNGVADSELTDEQSSALELSQYLIRQAL